MRILAVDPGEKRIGLALSDPSATLASPLNIIEHQSRAEDAARIAAAAQGQQAELIVVGYTVDIDGQLTPQARSAKRLAAAIREQAGVPVEMWEESGSSQAAHRARRELGLGREKRQQAIDDLAATVILQSYLDWRREQADE